MSRNANFGSSFNVFIAGLKNKLKRRPGYNFIEVLISLAVISVITIIIMPIITTRVQNKTFALTYQTQVKHMLSSLESLPLSENQDNITKTMMYVETDNGKYTDNAGKFLNKYMKVEKYCGEEPGDCFSPKYYEYKNHKKEEFNTALIKGACALLKNGVSICLKPQIKKTNGGRERVTGWIDLNGPKAPNTYGRDLRTFAIDLKYKAVFTEEDPTSIVTQDPPEVCTGNDCNSDNVDPCDVSPLSEACCDKTEMTAGHTCCPWYNDPSHPNYDTCYNVPCADDDIECKENKCDMHEITDPDDECCQLSEFKANNVACCKSGDLSDLCCYGVTNAQCCNYLMSRYPSSYNRDDACCEIDEVKAAQSQICKEPDACETNNSSKECCMTSARMGQIQDPSDACCDYDEVKAQANKCCRLKESDCDTCCEWKKANDAFVNGDNCCTSKYGLKDSGASERTKEMCCKVGSMYGDAQFDHQCCDYLVNKKGENHLQSDLRRCCAYTSSSQCCSADQDGMALVGFNSDSSDKLEFKNYCCKPGASESNLNPDCCFDWGDGDFNKNCCGINPNTTSSSGSTKLRNTSPWQENCCSAGSINYPNSNIYVSNCCTSSKWSDDCCELASQNDTWKENCCSNPAYATKPACCLLEWVDGCCSNDSLKSNPNWQDNCCSAGADAYPSKSVFKQKCCSGTNLNSGGNSEDAKYCCDPSYPTLGDCCPIFEENGWKDFDGNSLTSEAKYHCHSVVDDDSCSSLAATHMSESTWQAQCCGVLNNGLSDSEFKNYCCANGVGDAVFGSSTVFDARCCTTFSWGNACCSLDEDSCCRNTNYNSLQSWERGSWQDGCCMKPDFQNDETHGCCSWKLENNMGNFPRGDFARSYYYYDTEMCCTNGSFSGSTWVNNCCSTEFIYSADNSDRADCCRLMYNDSQVKDEMFSTGSVCCDALEVDLNTGIGNDGRYYEECLSKCANPMMHLSNDSSKSELYYPIFGSNHRQVAMECCAIGAYSDEVCCRLLEGSTSSTSDWIFKNGNSEFDTYPKCCNYRKNEYNVYGYQAPYYYVPNDSYVCPLPCTKNVCCDHKNDSDGWFCGEEDECVNWINDGNSVSDLNSCCERLKSDLNSAQVSECCGNQVFKSNNPGLCCGSPNVSNADATCCSYWDQGAINGNPSIKNACCDIPAYASANPSMCDPCPGYHDAWGSITCTFKNTSNNLLKCNLSGYSPGDTFYLNVSGYNKLTFPNYGSTTGEITDYELANRTDAYYNVSIKRGGAVIAGPINVDLCKGFSGSFSYNTCALSSGSITQENESLCYFDTCASVTTSNANDTCCPQWDSNGQITNNSTIKNACCDNSTTFANNNKDYCCANSTTFMNNNKSYCCSNSDFLISHAGFCCGESPSVAMADGFCCTYWHNNYCAWSSSYPSACIRNNIGVHTWYSGGSTPIPEQSACCADTSFFAYLQQHASEYSNNISRLYCCSHGANCTGNTKVDSLTMHCAAVPSDARQVSVTYKNQCYTNDVYNYRLKILHTCATNGYDICYNGFCTRYVNGLPQGTTLNCSNNGKIFYVAIEYCPNGDFSNCSPRAARGTTSYSSYVSDVGSFEETLNLGSCGN